MASPVPSIDPRPGRPSDAALAWAAASVGRGARVESIMALHGGWACATHAVDVVDAGGARHPLVLKRFFRSDWVAREPDVAAREAAVLRALEPAPLPTPALVAVDAVGSACDFPAVLMGRLPGRASLAPDDLDAWLRGIAEPLPVIHGLDGPLRDLVQPYRTYQDLASLAVPRWSAVPDAWTAVIRCAQRAGPNPDGCFLHRDYHPTNVLWTQGRLTGVLDWTNASWGPSGIDAGHCRLNLVQLYGVDVAERFLTLHLEHAGVAPGERDPACDALALVEVLPEPVVYRGWLDLGARGLTLGRVRERLDAYAALLASRV